MTTIRPQSDGSQMPTSAAPEPIHPELPPTVFALDTRNSLLALGGSAVAAIVLGILAYALAGSAGTEEGGFLFHVA